MSRVRIPPALRADVQGFREVEVVGDRVGDVLLALVRAYPGLEGKLLREGELQAYVNVYVDGEDVDTIAGLATPVQEGSTIILLPAMAGGESAPSADRLQRRSDPPRLDRRLNS